MGLARLPLAPPQTIPAAAPVPESGDAAPRIDFAIADLYDAIAHSDERLRPIRALRADTIREYGGRFWYEDDKRRRPLNLLKRGIRIMVAHLAGRNPTFDVSTERLDYRGTAQKIARQLQIRAERAGVVQFSRLCLLDAFFGGKCVVRIGEKSGPETVRNGDRLVHRGEVSRRRVPFDDWIFDPAAREESEAFFEGERYRIPRARALAAVDAGIFGYDATQEDAETPPLEEVASPDEARDLLTNAGAIGDGRTRQQDKGEDLTVGALSATQRHGLVDTIELIDLAVYLDSETCLLLTMLADKGAGPKYLRAEIWDGPSRGPYEHCEFDPVPDNPHGPSLASDMREQSELANTVIGKMANQIERTKRVLAYQKQRHQDALKISKAKDGETVGIDGDPKQMGAFDLGGVSPELAPFASLVVGWWNTQGGYDILGGQQGGPKRTATEDSRLGVMANVLIESMGDLFDDFHTRCAQHEAWYFWHDPFIKAPMTLRVPGAGRVEVVYSAAQRQGSFEDYAVKVRPRSMTRIDPNVRSQRVLQLVNAVVQAAQAEQVTQGRIDSSAVARILGHEFEVDELDEILRDPMLQQELAMGYGGMEPFAGQGRPAGQDPAARYGAGPALSSDQQQRASVMQQGRATGGSMTVAALGGLPALRGVA